MEKEINSFYETYDEEGRLSRDKMHMVEYLTTIRYLDRLFAPCSRILDVCAGAGRYSFYLADKGHIVTACDMVEHNVNIIKSNPNADKLADISVCNALDLSRFENNSFDIVLCMGALYHLGGNKQQAVSECVRVCKPGGIVVLAYITKTGAVLATINGDASNMDVLLKIIDDTDESIFFNLWPHEMDDIAEKCGLERMHHIGVDMIYPVIERLNNASDENFQKYMEFHYQICEDPSVIGASIHGLWIGRK